MNPYIIAGVLVIATIVGAIGIRLVAAVDDGRGRIARRARSSGEHPSVAAGGRAAP